MTLQQLHYFIAAAEHGSFSSAADALHMAQPSLSEQIRRLEAELGVQLFSRGRRLALTEAGRSFLPHAERTVAAAEEAADAVREVRTLAGGTITFGTFGNAPYAFTADLVEAFRLRHPDVNVRLVGQNSSEVAEAVRDGQIEAGLVVLPIDDRGLDVRPAIQDELVYLSANPKHTARPVTIETMATRRLILHDARFGWNDPVRRQLLDRAQRAGVRLEPVIEVEYMEASLELAARGFGDAIGALYLSFGRGFGDRLHTTTFDPPLYDTLAFIQRRNAHLSPGTREFLAIAEKRVADLVRGAAPVSPAVA